MGERIREEDIRFLRESFNFVGKNWKFFILAAVLFAIPLINVITYIFLAGYMLDFLPKYVKKRRKWHDLPQFDFMGSFINGIMLIVISLVYGVVFLLSLLAYILLLLVIFGGLYMLTSLAIFQLLGFLFLFIGGIVGGVLWMGMSSLAIAKYGINKDLSEALRIREVYSQTKNRQFWFLFIRSILYIFFIGLLLAFIIYLPSFISTYNINFSNLSPISIILEYLLLDGLFGAYRFILSFLIYGKLYNLRNRNA